MERTTTVQIRWGDMDAMGHVNNAAYLTYLETAREPWFAAVAGDDAFSRFALRRVEIDYLAQLTFEDREARVTVTLDGVGSSSVRTRERVETAAGRLVAEARAVIVHLDETGLRAAPLPEAVRAALGNG